MASSPFCPSPLYLRARTHAHTYTHARAQIALRINPANFVGCSMAAPLSVSVPLLPGAVATASVPLKVDAALAPQVHTAPFNYSCGFLARCSFAVSWLPACCSCDTRFDVPLLSYV
jgi:hypothetical protein